MVTPPITAIAATPRKDLGPKFHFNPVLDKVNVQFSISENYLAKDCFKF